MNTEQIKMVQDSFEQVRPIADKAAEIFYGRLFEVAPQTRHMFKNDMTKQGAMLMSTLGLAVGSLNDLDKIIPAVHALGRRHAGYGVQFDQFAVVGESLLWTLEQAFGPAFTLELKTAWTEAYLLLAGVMQEAMREVMVMA
jgi:hemoglobin-like flavoprotein